ncbi:MAG: lipid-A-disaccharide synthase [Bacteroidales bacterium]|nr:lipid-A-disaccharide synthase [Bacteroidales bacterium]
MRYFIIAGEQSGDLHGSNLVRKLLDADKNAEIFCWGGDLMESAGATLLMHYSKTAIMGILLILKNIRTIKSNYILCKKQIAELKPDVVILIDYPGFNLKIAKYSKKSGFRVFYYISPKFWAWREHRVKQIKKYTDRIYIIFPFEVEFYKKHKISVEYHGNPLVDEIEGKISSLPARTEIKKLLRIGEKPVVAILAGSRRFEVEYNLPQMVKVVRYFPQYQFVLAGVRNLPDDLYFEIIGKEPVMLIKEKTYEILYVAEAAMVASGTATLETALFDTPQVVGYKGDIFSMLIVWLLLKVKFVSLVNLILDSEVVKELLGYSLTGKNLMSELKSILPGGQKREKMLAEYKKLKEILGPSGASGRIAKDMVDNMRVRGGD